MYVSDKISASVISFGYIHMSSNTNWKYVEEANVRLLCWKAM